jgi:hypothetical protein
MSYDWRDEVAALVLEQLELDARRDACIIIHPPVIRADPYAGRRCPKCALVGAECGC